ncbi:cupin domain-containing protein [Rhizobium leguminosarum]|uniref:cupin domain-containing protein n=1 Tax=Rhizobium leguminosarum TaxID=384 RepID=UPI0032B2F422
MRLKPGASSSLRHWHAVEDEFIHVLEGTLTLLDDNGPHELTPGMFAAFPAGEGNGHHIQNRSDRPHLPDCWLTPTG